MSFADQLRAAKGTLTAREVAAIIDPNLSHRTVEDWLAGRREPVKWQRKIIISKVKNNSGQI